jgi:hypothetical protein
VSFSNAWETYTIGLSRLRASETKKAQDKSTGPMGIRGFTRLEIRERTPSMSKPLAE